MWCRNLSAPHGFQPVENILQKCGKLISLLAGIHNIYSSWIVSVQSAVTAGLQSLGATACYHLISIFYIRQNRNNLNNLSWFSSWGTAKERDVSSKYVSTCVCKMDSNKRYKHSSIGLFSGPGNRLTLLLKPRTPWNLETKMKKAFLFSLCAATESPMV